jgi:hypothetical protein
MALIDIQQYLTQVLTSKEMREGLGDGSGFLELAEGPSKAAIHAVLTIPPRKLRHYADTLVNKRCRAVGKCLPATLRMLGADRFRELFCSRISANWPSGPARHRSDAIAFAQTLARAPEPDWPDGVIDIAAYESAALQAQDPNRRLVVWHARYTPEDLIRASMTGQTAVDLIRRPTIVIWFRFRKGGALRVFRFSTPHCLPTPSASATRLM